MKINLKEYNIDNDINTDIVLISDIHYYNKKDIYHLNKVLEKIKLIKPKFICIPGDIIDEAKIQDEDFFICWLSKLGTISKVIMSIGNHEYYINKRKRIFQLNDKLFNRISKLSNIYLLDNTNIVIDNINFMGLTLPIKHYIDNKESNINFDKYLDNIKINKNNYNILLCHSPISICNKKILKDYDIDLILCGHMHGGITPRFLRPILKNKGLINPIGKLFPSYAYGNIKINNTNIIVTSGILVISRMNHFKLLKNLFSSEIVVIKINKKSD